LKTLPVGIGRTFAARWVLRLECWLLLFGGAALKRPPEWPFLPASSLRPPQFGWQLQSVQLDPVLVLAVGRSHCRLQMDAATLSLLANRALLNCAVEVGHLFPWLEAQAPSPWAWGWQCALRDHPKARPVHCHVVRMDWLMVMGWWPLARVEPRVAALQQVQVCSQQQEEQKAL